MNNSEGRKKKILILDDEKHTVTFFETLLRKHGYAPIPTTNVEDALEAAHRETPDLVILDLLMPKRTGTDFARKLSRDKQLKNIPIIVVSGLAGRDLAVRKPAAVFDKPVDTEKFLQAVEDALGCAHEKAV
jgi:CheY-like chemotaxis protein